MSDKIEVGTVLVCHTDLVMNEGNEIEATKGKEYPVIRTRGSELTIQNNSNRAHNFNTNPSRSSFRSWFKVKEKKSVMERIAEIEL
jgi:hypothetical protein